MVYMGSKNRLCKYIVPVLQNAIDSNDISHYVELFGGGCNVADKINCQNRLISDVNYPLIKLLKYVQENPTIPIAPDSVSFEHFKDVRDAQGTGKYSDEYTALVGYCASYCGGYFPRGYARGNTSTGEPRNMYFERLNNLRRQADNLRGIDFQCMDYKDFDFANYPKSVIYLDPPYRNTKQYVNQSIDYDEFYDACRNMAQYHIIFISERWMPDDFTCVWSMGRKMMLDSGRHEGLEMTEKLFTYERK